uniref:NADH-ubiquinone oxidoreductase chain 1 n=1 Tax=Chordodes sp. VVA-2019 TaxID=2586751 RepID=A0A514ABV7_9BILA|nr:NADH dehydrogenase subunit 1 [Chordodes sp. VVA-2019]
MVLFEVVLTQASLLVSMSFYTLLERKMLGSAQLRKGPNKVPILGLVQPFMDALKLLSKKNLFYSVILKRLWKVVPILGLVLYLVLFEVVLTQASYALKVYSTMLMMMVLLSLSVYSIMIMGWTSNNKFTNMGATRAVSQAISYELILSLLLLILAALSCNLLVLQWKDNLNYLFTVMLGGCMMMLLSSMAEVNRTPFDLMEGESELVSGFNTEFFGGYFALIFMGEYMGMMFFSYFMSYMFMNQFMNMYLMFFAVVMSILIVEFRLSFPRFRYDLLMKFCWEVILYIILMWMFFYLLLF